MENSQNKMIAEIDNSLIYIKMDLGNCIHRLNSLVNAHDTSKDSKETYEYVFFRIGILTRQLNEALALKENLSLKRSLINRIIRFFLTY